MAADDPSSGGPGDEVPAFPPVPPKEGGEPEPAPTPAPSPVPVPEPEPELVPTPTPSPVLVPEPEPPVPAPTEHPPDVAEARAPTLPLEPLLDARPPASVTAPDGPPAAATESPALLRSWIVMLVMAASLVMVLWNMQTRSLENANTGSRYATIESLVDYGTYSIDASRYARTPDKVKARGHWVSSKPPLLPTYGAGVYWVVKKLTGYTLAQNEGVIVWTVGMFTGWLSHLVFLIYFYRLACLVLRRQLAIVVAIICAGFAYLGTAYGTAINNHSVGAAFQVMGFFYAYRARTGIPSRPRDWLLAGLWLGLLPPLDLPSLSFTALVGLYLLTKNWKWTLLLFAPAALPGLLLEPLLAHASTGSWLPAYSNPDMYNFPGSYFKNPSGIDALREPKTIYAFHMLLGHHGLFSMTPLYFFALYEVVRRFVKKEAFRPEIAVWIGTLAIFLAFHIRGTRNYGGWCVGMRWLVPVMPWLLLIFALWFDRVKLTRLVRVGVLSAFLVSAYHVQDGLSSPFQFSVWHNLLDGTPNRSRLGPTWNLAKPPPRPAKPRKPAPRRPATPAAKPK